MQAVLGDYFSSSSSSPSPFFSFFYFRDPYWLEEVMRERRKDMRETKRKSCVSDSFFFFRYLLLNVLCILVKVSSPLLPSHSLYFHPTSCFSSDRRILPREIKFIENQNFTKCFSGQNLPKTTTIRR